jgi:hypothetical protein
MFTGHKSVMISLWKGCGIMHSHVHHQHRQLQRGLWHEFTSLGKSLYVKVLLGFGPVLAGELGTYRKFQATREICTFPTIRCASATQAFRVASAGNPEEGVMVLRYHAWLRITNPIAPTI